MPVKRLFNPDNETYTNEGNDLETEIHYLLAPIINRCLKDNYAMRDVAYIIFSHVDVECAIGLLQRQSSKKWKEKYGKD